MAAEVKYSFSNSYRNTNPRQRRGQLVEKVRFLFCASCDSTHKIEFAQQIHKNRGAWSRPPSLAAMRQFTLCTSGIIQGTKNCARRARLFVKIRLKAWFQSRGCSKNGVFRQPQKDSESCLFVFTESFICLLIETQKSEKIPQIIKRRILSPDAIIKSYRTIHWENRIRTKGECIGESNFTAF